MTAPYRHSEALLARYALRSVRSEAVKRAAGVLLLACVSAALVLALGGAPRLTILGVLPLVALLVAIVAVRGLPSVVVRDGAEVRVYRTHITVPTAVGSERHFSIKELEVDVRSRVTGADAHVIEGQRVVVPRSIPISIELIGRSERRKLSALLFETPGHATRLASDVQRLRQGKDPIDHENPDLGEMMDDFQQVFSQFFEQQRPQGPGDERPR